MKRVATFLFCTLAVAACFPQAGSPHGASPKQGFVPKTNVALSIADAVLIPVYGKKVIDAERPFKAVLNGNVWTVTGSIPCDGPPRRSMPRGSRGVKISKRTGQILFMTHYQ
jgi:NTF2 fold immunity protein